MTKDAHQFERYGNSPSIKGKHKGKSHARDEVIAKNYRETYSYRYKSISITVVLMQRLKHINTHVNRLIEDLYHIYEQRK